MKRIMRDREKKMLTKWESIYGGFDAGDYEAFSVRELPNESGYYHGELVKWSAGLNPNCLLFVGENVETVKHLKDKMHARKVITAGLGKVDFIWNFEQNAPDIDEEIDLIVSHAIFEHLLRPYKHFNELAKLVRAQGYIIIHTVMPGFRYHRYPIDAMRFYPDWFEESGSRLNLKVVRRRIKGHHIFYMYQKMVS